MTLDEFLAQIEARANAVEQTWKSLPELIGKEHRALETAHQNAWLEFTEHARTDVPTLLAMLRLAIEQRNHLGSCLRGGFDESFYNTKLLKLAEGK